MFLKYKNKKGFSFTEVVVSITLLLVVLVCISGVYYYCKMGAKKATELSQCMHLAQWKLAEVVYLEAKYIETSPGTTADISTWPHFSSPGFENYAYRIEKLTPAGTKLSDFTEIKVTAAGLSGAKISLVALKSKAKIYARGIIYTGRGKQGGPSLWAGGDFWSYDPATGTCTNLSNFASKSFDPVHIVDQRTSFDGKRIIFIVTDGNGNYNWHMLNLENNTVAPFTIKDGENTITPTLVRLTATNWSGNNNLISVQLGNTIYLTDYNGTVFDKIQSCEGTLYHFNSNYLSMHSWSRGTNEMVYFGRSVNNKSKLYKYNPATKSSQEITAAGEWQVNSAGSPSAPETSVYHPTLTPDGKGVLLFTASTTPQGGDLVFSTSKCMVDLVNNIKTTSSAIQYYKEFGGNIHVPLEFGAWGKWDTTSYCYSPVKGASGYVPGVNYFYKNLTELTGSPGYIYRHEGGQWYIDSSPDGNKFVINNYGDIKILDKQGNVIQNVTPSSGVGVWLYDCRAEWR